MQDGYAPQIPYTNNLFEESQKSKNGIIQDILQGYLGPLKDGYNWVKDQLQKRKEAKIAAKEQSELEAKIQKENEFSKIASPLIRSIYEVAVSEQMGKDTYKNLPEDTKQYIQKQIDTYLDDIFPDQISKAKHIIQMINIGDLPLYRNTAHIHAKELVQKLKEDEIYASKDDLIVYAA